MDKKNKSIHLNIKADSVGDDGTFEGYGSVFNVLDSYGDKVVPGAFEKTINERKGKIALLWQHQPSQPIGVWLSMSEDSIGLKCKGKLLVNSNVPKADEAYSLLKAGAISGLSIGYIPVQQETDNKTGITTVKEVKLYETSLVTFPANESATVTQIRSAFDELTEEQRIKTLNFINTLTKSLEDATSRQCSEASEQKHSEVPQADTNTDEPLLHSLEILIKAMKA